MARLAESGDDLWKKFVELSTTGIVSKGKVRYPYALIVGVGLYMYRAHDGLVKCQSGCFTYDMISNHEKDEFHKSITADQVRIQTQSHAGYESEYKQPRVLEILHEPHGLSFQPG